MEGDKCAIHETAKEIIGSRKGKRVTAEMKLKAITEPGQFHIQTYLHRAQSNGVCATMWVAAISREHEVVCTFAIGGSSNSYIAMSIQCVDEEREYHNCEINDVEDGAYDSTSEQFIEDFTNKLLMDRLLKRITLSRLEKDEMNFLFTRKRTPMALSDALLCRAYLYILEAKRPVPPYTGARIGLPEKKALVVEQAPVVFQNVMWRLTWALAFWPDAPRVIYRRINDAIVYIQDALDEGANLEAVAEVEKSAELIRLENLARCQEYPQIQKWLGYHSERLIARLRYASNDGAIF